MSPLPFGIYPVPDRNNKALTFDLVKSLSPLPFGIYPVPDKIHPNVVWTTNPGVSIAFRHLRRSRPLTPRARWRRSLGRLHCLSAFTPFPTDKV